MISVLGTILSFFFSLWFLWLPFFIWSIFWKQYKRYKEENYVFEKMSPDQYDLFEIFLPRDIFRSPQGMEFVIDILWNISGGAMSWLARLLRGAVLIPSSLEIVSIEGNIYFFIRVHKSISHLVKNTLYSQYPNIEINEVDDYTKYVPDLTKNLENWDLFGMDYKLVDKAFIPIRTYVDYGLDRVSNVYEEQKIDPLIPLLELMGGIGKGEQLWLQIIVRADVFSKWRDDAKEYIAELVGKSGGDDSIPIAKLTPGEREKIRAIERSLSKYAFEAVIRTLYLAPKKYFQSKNIGILGHFFKPFNSQYHNSIIPRALTGVAWGYQDMTKKKVRYLKKTFFRDYVNRESFYESPEKRYHPFWKNFRNRPLIIFTSEELATLFHLPGKSATTSAISRIESRKADAPKNLPIE